MTDVKVRRINVALTFGYYFKETQYDLNKLLKSLLGTELELETTISKALKSAADFFGVNPDYTENIRRFYGTPAFQLQLKYDRFTPQKPETRDQIIWNLQPILILSILSSNPKRNFDLSFNPKSDETEVGSMFLVTLLFDLQQDLDIDESTDLGVALEQMVYGSTLTITETTDKGQKSEDTTIEKYLSKILSRLNLKDFESVSGGSFSSAVAISGFRQGLKEKFAKQLYGALMGDEGWRDVPQVHAVDRLSKVSWSSREYTRLYFAPTSALLVGEYFDRLSREVLLLNRESWQEYIQLSQSTEVPPLFWHGFFLTYEWTVFGKGIYALIQSRLGKKTQFYRDVAVGEEKARVKDLESELETLERYRKQIGDIKAILSEESVGLPEIVNMMRVLRENFGVTDLGRRLDNSLQVLTSIHDKLYQRLTVKANALQRFYFQILSTLIAVISLVSLTPLFVPLSLFPLLDIDAIRGIITLVSLGILTIFYFIKSRR
jgi:hypothetical protein